MQLHTARVDNQQAKDTKDERCKQSFMSVDPTRNDTATCKKAYDRVSQSEEDAAQINGACFGTDTCKKHSRGTADASARSCILPSFTTTPAAFSIPPFATNLHMHQERQTLWSQLLSWLPSAESLQAGLLPTTSEESTQNEIRPHEKQSNRETAKGGKGAKHNEPAGLEGNRAHIDIEKLELVKGLRDWVLMQPIYLGRPVAPANPTFHSLVTRWAEKEGVQHDDMADVDRIAPGRTYSVEGEDLCPDNSTQSNDTNPLGVSNTSECSSDHDPKESEAIETKTRRKRKRGNENEEEPTGDAASAPASPVKTGGRRGKKRGGAKKEDKLRHLRPPTIESCHRCKNRKEHWMGCPIVEAHRYCKGCVERHFNLDYETNSPKSAEIWAEGCPICLLTCQCAACRRRKEALDAGLSPSSKRRKSESDVSEYLRKGGGEELMDTTKVRRTRSSVRKLQQQQEEAADTKTEEKPKELASNGCKGITRQACVKAEDSASDRSSSDVEDKQHAGHTPKKASVIQTRSRTKGATRKKSKVALSDEDEDDEDEEEEEVYQPAPTPAVTPVVRQENGYYVLEDSDNVEAFVGLTGAGSVLSRRYSSPSFPRAAVVKIQGGGW